VELTFSPLPDVVDGRLELRGGLGDDLGGGGDGFRQRRKRTRPEEGWGRGIQEVATVTIVAPVSAPVMAERGYDP
jgi:hypothetical protein